MDKKKIIGWIIGASLSLLAAKGLIDAKPVQDAICKNDGASESK